MPVARVDEFVIGEIFPSRESLAGKYHPDFIAGLQDVPEGVQVGWVWHEGEWKAALPAASSAVPDKVSAAQARIALLRAGLLAPVEAAIKAGGGEIEIWFEYATEWHRDNVYISTLGSQLKLTDRQLDELFILAASIG